MKKTLLLFLFTVTVNISGTTAQSFTPDVIASAGIFATSAEGSMSWTIGETMTETYSPGSNFFTQGFHQPDLLLITAIQSYTENTISVFPNPVVDNLFIRFSVSSASYTIDIFDVQGNLVKKEIVTPNTSDNYRISFEDLSNGMYLIRIINTANNSINSYKVNKIY